jgi:hypothetical protein
MNKMHMIMIAKVAITPGGVASLSELGEDLKCGIKENKSSLFPSF